MQRRLGKSPAAVKSAKVWSEHARRLAIGLHNICQLWTPEIVVFGGSMMRDVDLELVGREMSTLPHSLASVPKLEYAKLGDRMGLMGAVAALRAKSPR